MCVTGGGGGGLKGETFYTEIQQNYLNTSWIIDIKDLFQIYFTVIPNSKQSLCKRWVKIGVVDN